MTSIAVTLLVAPLPSLVLPPSSEDAVIAAPAADQASEVADSTEILPTPEEGNLRVVAFVDLAYIYNDNRPNNHVYRGINTSPRTNEFALNLAGFWLLREATARSPWWLQVGLQAGAAADAVYGGEPMPGGEDSRFAGSEVFKHVSLANAGVTFKTGTDVGAGVFGSPVGIGSLFAKDKWLYTNTWEVNWVPYYLMGLRVGQELGAGFRAEAWIVNGFQMIGDVNRVPSYMLSLYWNRGDFSVGQHVFFGPEQEDISPRGWLVHSDTQLTWSADWGGIAAVFDVGRDEPLEEPRPGSSLWIGAAVPLRLAVYKGDDLRLDVVARGQTWWDKNGRTFGNDGWLASGSGGLALFTLNRSIDLHVEYRYDWSSDPRGFFYRGSATHPGAPGLAADQHNIVVALVGQLDVNLLSRFRP